MKRSLFSQVKPWLRPGFNWRYPGNQIAVVLVFLGAFFGAGSVFAIEDTSGEEGYFYSVWAFSIGGYGDKSSDALSAWCSSYSGAFNCSLQSLNYGIYETSSGSQGGVAIKKKECSVQTSTWLEQHPEVCGPVGPDCPDTGTVKRVGTAVTGTYENGVFTEDLPEGGFQLGGVVSAGGCEYVSPTMLQPGAAGHGTDLNSQVKCSKSSGACFRYQNFVSSGTAREPGENEPWSGVAGDPEVPEVPNESTEASTDTRESRTSTTSTDPITEQVGDTTQTTQTTTTTETRGDGSVVQSQDDVTTVTRSDGITRTDTQTTVTTTNADGSKTVETTNNISYTQHPQTVYNIDRSNNRVTVTATGGGTSTQQTRTVEDFSSDGTKTGETREEGPVQGDDNAREEQEEETCDTNPLMDRCIGEFDKGDGGEFASGMTEMNEARDEYQELFDDIKDQVKQKFNFGVNGGGTIQSNEITLKGVSGDIGFSKWVPYLDQFNFGALVLAVAGILAAYIVLGGSSRG